MNETPPCANSPVAEWRFDEGSWSGVANEVVDSSGSNYHGVAVNVSTVGGVLCKAADLSANSASDYFIHEQPSDEWVGGFYPGCLGKILLYQRFSGDCFRASGTRWQLLMSWSCCLIPPTGLRRLFLKSFFNDTGDISHCRHQTMMPGINLPGPVKHQFVKVVFIWMEYYRAVLPTQTVTIPIR